MRGRWGRKKKEWKAGIHREASDQHCWLSRWESLVYSVQQTQFCLYLSHTHTHTIANKRQTLVLKIYQFQQPQHHLGWFSPASTPNRWVSQEKRVLSSWQRPLPQKLFPRPPSRSLSPHTCRHWSTASPPPLGAESQWDPLTFHERGHHPFLDMLCQNRSQASPASCLTPHLPMSPVSPWGPSKTQNQCRRFHAEFPTIHPPQEFESSLLWAQRTLWYFSSCPSNTKL